MTPSEQGKADGKWTKDQVRLCGWKSASDCLANEERAYQEGLEELPKFSSQFAAKQKEYLDAMIAQARESLGLLIQAEKQSQP